MHTLRKLWPLLFAAMAPTYVLGSPPDTAWPKLVLDAKGSADSKRDAAVIVAIDRYSEVPPVPGATRNGDDWYTYLTRVRGIPPARVSLLRDGEATRERIVRHSKEAADRVGANGTLWFVFIGHGTPTPEGGALVGYDAQQDTASLFARSVRQSELTAIFERATAGRRIMVVDACFSGRTADGRPLAPGVQPLLAVKDKPSKSASLLVMAAGRADQFAGPLPGANRPAFSYLLLGGLTGWADGNRDKQVTAGEAVTWARDTLRAVVPNRTQTPQLSGQSDVVLARAATAPAPDIGALRLGKRTPASTGLRLTAYLICQRHLGGGRFEDVPDCPATGLRAGDRMKVGFQVDRKARVYIFVHNETGQFQTLFPDPGIDNVVDPGRETFLPSGNDWFVADELTNVVEHIHVIAAPDRVAELEALRGIDVAPGDRPGAANAVRRLRSTFKTRGFVKKASRPVTLSTGGGPVATLPVLASSPGESAVEFEIPRR